MKLMCDKCGEKVERFKYLRKIKGKRYCKHCANIIRKEHREKMIEGEGIKGELNRLKNKINKEKGYAKKSYEKKVGHKVRERKEKGYTPTIKGSTFGKPREKSNSYLTFEEKKNLLKILMNRGLEFEEATERIKNLIEEQKRVSGLMKSKGNSEKEIKIKQKEILEELWRY